MIKKYTKNTRGKFKILFFNNIFNDLLIILISWHISCMFIFCYNINFIGSKYVYKYFNK